MKKVYQTDTTNKTGNCLQACVASLLNLRLEQVPEFRKLDPENPVWELRKYLEAKGYSLIEVKNLWRGSPNTLCIVAVQSDRHKEGYHAVVGKITPSGAKIKLVFDPNRDTQKIVGDKLNYIRLYFFFQGSRYLKN